MPQQPRVIWKSGSLPEFSSNFELQFELPEKCSCEPLLSQAVISKNKHNVVFERNRRNYEVTWLKNNSKRDILSCFLHEIIFNQSFSKCKLNRPETDWKRRLYLRCCYRKAIFEHYSGKVVVFNPSFLAISRKNCGLNDGISRECNTEYGAIKNRRFPQNHNKKHTENCFTKTSHYLRHSVKLTWKTHVKIAWKLM